jgi:hypothetical protein
MPGLIFSRSALSCSGRSDWMRASPSSTPIQAFSKNSCAKHIEPCTSGGGLAIIGVLLILFGLFRLTRSA